ncbi:MAG: hypothetical protein M3Q31_21235 [Actinomycetota bacterium]|nr:hypothetical protein [Actinomycetota bacterium]
MSSIASRVIALFVQLISTRPKRLRGRDHLLTDLAGALVDLVAELDLCAIRGLACGILRLLRDLLRLLLRLPTTVPSLPGTAPCSAE